IHAFVHPIVKVLRDGAGRLVELLPWETDGPAESLIHVEIDRQAEQTLLAELAATLERALGDVQAAVEDWPAMREQVRAIVAELDERPPAVAPDELTEAKALLEWMRDDHFTFLGLYTHTAYRATPWEIPVLRRKAERVVERSGFVAGGHDYKALVEILESYPRDELFQIGDDELFDTVVGILHLGERRRVRLFV